MSNATPTLRTGANGLYDTAKPPFDGGDEDTDEMTVPAAAPQEILDDISSLTVSSDDTVLSGTREIITKVAVRKPKKDEFFRTHPTAYKGPYVVYEVKAQMETEVYLISPTVWEALPDLLTGHVKRVTLRATMARSGLLFLHPVVESDPLRKTNDYHESAREAALQAVHSWCRMQADTAVGHYKVWIAEGNLGEPKWPDFDLKELINKAFKGRVISDPAHEIVEALRGEV
jgi:hypothetical protein